MALSEDAKKYYEGGYRITIDGVPTRLSFKPSKNVLAMMRDKKPDPVQGAMRFPEVRYTSPEELAARHNWRSRNYAVA
jgi:hypothetical protein